MTICSTTYHARMNLRKLSMDFYVCIYIYISLRKMMYWHMFVWFQKCQGRLKCKKHQIWSSFSIANTFCMGKKLMNPWLCLLAQWPSRVGPRTFLPCTPSSTNMFTVCFSKMRSTWQPRLPRSMGLSGGTQNSSLGKPWLHKTLSLSTVTTTNQSLHHLEDDLPVYKIWLCTLTMSSVKPP